MPGGSLPVSDFQVAAAPRAASSRAAATAIPDAAAQTSASDHSVPGRRRVLRRVVVPRLAPAGLHRLADRNAHRHRERRGDDLPADLAGRSSHWSPSFNAVCSGEYPTRPRVTPARHRRRVRGGRQAATIRWRVGRTSATVAAWRRGSRTCSSTSTRTAGWTRRPRPTRRAPWQGFLRWQRETLELKCAGLDPEQLARRAVPPSTLSLLGLVRHLADVERSWFRRGLAGEDVPPLFVTSEDAGRRLRRRGGRSGGRRAGLGGLAGRGRVRRPVRRRDARPAVGQRGRPRRGPLSLRWVLVHMIEEYARHIGHADLLRQLIDGRVGQ